MRRAPKPAAAITGSCSAPPPGSARPTACCWRDSRPPTAGMDVVIGYLEPHDRTETIALAEGLETVPRRRIEHRGAWLEEMDVDAVLAARSRAGAGRRAGPHQRAGRANTQALRGHRRGARRRDRRDLDGQHPAPGEPQRPGLRADRGAGARDLPRPGAGRRRRGRADRPHPRGAAGAHPGRQGVPAGSGRHGTVELLHAPSGCRRCASWPCARWPRMSRPGRRRR